MKLVKTLVLSATLAPVLSSAESLTIHPSGVWHVFVLRVHYLAMVALVKAVKQLLIFARLSLNLTRNTSAVWISCKSWWTFTGGPMVVYSALSTSSTWIINAAGVNTSSISAGLTGGTFIIT